MSSVGLPLTLPVCDTLPSDEGTQHETECDAAGLVSRCDSGCARGCRRCGRISRSGESRNPCRAFHWQGHGSHRQEGDATWVNVPFRPVPARNMIRELPHWTIFVIYKVTLAC